MINKQEQQRIRSQEEMSRKLEMSFMTNRHQTIPFESELREGMIKELTGHDVCEIYSPPRVTRFAAACGFTTGCRLDLTVCDIDGNVWDFARADMIERVRTLIDKDKPTLVIGSPTRTNFSSIMNLNWHKMTETEQETRMKEARAHLDFCPKCIGSNADKGYISYTSTPFQRFRGGSPESWYSRIWKGLSRPERTCADTA